MVAIWLAPAHAAPLGRAIGDVLADERLAGASVSVWIGPSGAPWATVDGDRRVVPASVVKLVTAAALLEALPADTTWRTEVLAAGPVADGVLQGDLVIVGGGDPSLGSDDPGAPLAAVTAAVRAAGVARIEGSVVGDGRAYAGPAHGAGWMWDDLSAPWSPAISALSWNRGVAEPPCEGVAGPGSPVEDPAACFAAAVTEALEAAGVGVDGEPRAAREADDGVHLGAPLASLEGPPLADLLGTTLQRSDNAYAEALWRHLDPETPATAAGARAEVAALFAAVGAEDAAPIDGSGLSRYSALSAHTLVRVLDRAEAAPWGPVLAGLLPAAGESGSTLGERLPDLKGRLSAKTGSMTGVRNLAGWVTDADGRTAPFAVLLTGFSVPQADAIALQDRIVRLAAASRHGRVSRRTARAIAPPPAGSAPGSDKDPGGR